MTELQIINSDSTGWKRVISAQIFNLAWTKPRLSK